MPGQSFDRVATEYDATRGWPPGVAAQIGGGLYDALALFARPGQRLRVIEAGAGTGRVLLPLAGAGAWTAGVDISAGMLCLLREKAAAAQLPGAVRAVRGDAYRLPFATHTFDAGLMVHVLHLVDDWRPVFEGTAEAWWRDAIGVHAGARHDGRLRREGALADFRDPTGRLFVGVTALPLRKGPFSAGASFDYERAMPGTGRLPAGVNVAAVARVRWKP